MYDTSAAEVARPSLARVEGPLTQEIMESMNRAQDTASEVRHRLYQLRDRLTGSPPPTESMANANKTESSHFKGAFSDRAAGLLATLADIDNISTDLANRL